jgi:mono/diheme cytochrome c family protein
MTHSVKNIVRLLFVSAAALVIAGLVELPNSAAQKALDFNRDIRPILSNNCFACHGPDEQQRKAKLRLDTKDGAFAKTGVIVAKDAANSRLYKRIIHKDENAVMPPPATGHKLTEAQIALIKRWIDEGAQWNEHWAFVAPVRSELPTVSNPAWVKNGIDAFVLARLD